MATLQVRDVPQDVYDLLCVNAKYENRSIAQQTVTLLQEALHLRHEDTKNKTFSNQNNAELPHVEALRKISKLRPVSLEPEYSSAADILDEIRKEENR